MDQAKDYVYRFDNSFTPFLVEEVLNFTQVDLVTDDVMLLDTGDTMFAWLGIDANKVERNAVLVTAKDYLLSDPSGRNVDIPIIVVKQGFEPPHFKAYFGAWDPDVWPKNSSGIQDMKELKLSDISDDISGMSKISEFFGQNALNQG